MALGHRGGQAHGWRELVAQVGAIWRVSQAIRCMLYRRLASPILVRARAMPMVRMKRPIGPFWRAKTCSTAARTADLRALARAVRRGIGLPLGFLRWICERSRRPARNLSLALER